MDYNYSVLRKARNSKKVCIKGERGEEEDRSSEKKRQWYKFQSFTQLKSPAKDLPVTILGQKKMNIYVTMELEKLEVQISATVD